MDLLLWRHAEAYDANEDQPDDLLRPLTPRGLKQAQRMAKWLELHMPEGVRILCSPAVRCESTVAALRRKYKICPELSPDGNARALIELANWPEARMPVLVVGHQPILGQVITQVLNMPEQNLSVRKGAVWWLRSRMRLDTQHTLVHCVQSPDLLW
ncbi:histidine phosphatase family protein [Variovorax sp. PCZ-1]|uniref:SixA phosphatase family protein n=1 Tax=Variovorax sp. PCZ-1 TaxID=2835533 RepID=UPI001BCD9A5F|nr:histidine phosphatase family protein [Variovorax sp. PCZ-1]MBS7806689.1 histidine phosphatase family protein [Variovorax sp. PCZ-1]